MHCTRFRVLNYTYTVATTTSPGDFVRWFVVNNTDLRMLQQVDKYDSLVNTQNEVLAALSPYIDPAMVLVIIF